MKDLLTPKQVARAIGVSESSLKRWCDDGRIPTVRTAGGHRRLPISGVVGFLRESGQRLVEPELLGLPSMTGTGERTLDRASERLEAALVAGDEATARRIVLDLYLAGHSVAAIGDQAIAPAFEAIGRRWGCGEVAVFQERRACEISLRILHELRTVLPPVDHGRLAIGGTPEGDPYQLATTLVELALAERGWRACSLGASLPFDTLLAALSATQPALFWLSASHVTDEAAFVAGCESLFAATVAAGIPLVVGGRALTDDLRPRLRYAAHCDRLRNLEDLLAALPQPSGRANDPETAAPVAAASNDAP